MRRVLPGLLLVAVACTSGTVDLDVSTSVIDIPTTTTTAQLSRTTTTAPLLPSTTIDEGLQPIVPDVAQVVPIRPVLLSDDSGQARAEVDPDRLVTWIVEANQVYASARIGFSYDPGRNGMSSPTRRPTGSELRTRPDGLIGCSGPTQLPRAIRVSWWSYSVVPGWTRKSDRTISALFSWASRKGS